MATRCTQVVILTKLCLLQVVFLWPALILVPMLWEVTQIIHCFMVEVLDLLFFLKIPFDHQHKSSRAPSTLLQRYLKTLLFKVFFKTASIEIVIIVSQCGMKTNQAFFERGGRGGEGDVAVQPSASYTGGHPLKSFSCIFFLPPRQKFTSRKERPVERYEKSSFLTSRKLRVLILPLSGLII